MKNRVHSHIAAMEREWGGGPRSGIPKKGFRCTKFSPVMGTTSISALQRPREYSALLSYLHILELAPPLSAPKKQQFNPKNKLRLPGNKTVI